MLRAYFEKNLEALGLPTACKKDPADWAMIKSAVNHELSQMRAAMKSKLDLAIKNRDDLYVLTVALMMYDMKPKYEHWGRLAFLRDCAKTWNNRSATDKKKLAFWDFVDGELSKLRACFKAIAGKDRRVEEASCAHDGGYYDRFFASLVAKDLDAYAINSGELARTIYTNESVSDLQRNIEKVVGTFMTDDIDSAAAAQNEAPVEDLPE
ncbi:hypothetical protein A0H81_07155 [Grifola frondosa]|uniref:Uncharacterized protein n=1 Tax=Grifola frondosa TaxID=5627 RepID=A0A1C7M949_GRIFR|nr:hypothetical protein A0H81_07155 [Grifola frondosa]